MGAPSLEKGAAEFDLPSIRSDILLPYIYIPSLGMYIYTVSYLGL